MPTPIIASHLTGGQVLCPIDQDDEKLSSFFEKVAEYCKVRGCAVSRDPTEGGTLGCVVPWPECRLPVGANANALGRAIWAFGRRVIDGVEQQDRQPTTPLWLLADLQTYSETGQVERAGEYFALIKTKVRSELSGTASNSSVHRPSPLRVSVIPNDISIDPIPHEISEYGRALAHRVQYEQRAIRGPHCLWQSSRWEVQVAEAVSVLLCAGEEVLQYGLMRELSEVASLAERL